MFDVNADYQVMQFKYYIGGPLAYIAGYTLQAGIPINPALSTATTTVWTPGVTNTIGVGSASAFISKGVICITGVKGSNWFTYESHDSTNFYTCVRISGADADLPATSVVTQWRDVTSLVDECEINMITGDVEGYYNFTITKGAEWNSLIQFQDASFMVQESHYDSTYAQWTPFVTFYIGFLGPIESTATKDGPIYKVSVHGYWEYLKNTQVVADTYGLEKLAGTRTASTTLVDVGSEPSEGIRPADFNPSETGDNNKYTLWCSTSAPTNSDLPFYTGSMQSLNNVTAGYGTAKITQIYCSGRDTNFTSRQDQTVIEIYNPDHTNVQDNGVVNKQYHQIMWTGIVVENSRMQRLYLNSKNGYGLGDAGFEAQSFLYLVLNQKITSQFATFPQPSTTVEYRYTDGWQFQGGNTQRVGPHEKLRNLGQQFYLDPRGDWLAIRVNKGINGSAKVPLGAAGTNAVGTYASVYPGTQTIRVTSTAGFQPRGMLHDDTNDIWITYDGIDANHFKNVIWHDSKIYNSIIDNDALYQVLFHDYWLDFVAWGDKQYWGVYPDGVTTGPSYGGFFAHQMNDSGDGTLDETSENQNLNGYDANKVWGTRDGGGVFTPGFNTNVSPTGIPDGASIRRKGLIGNYTGNDGAGVFTNMDGGTADDWQVLSTPIWGNVANLATVEWLKVDLGEHRSATVLSDNIANYGTYVTNAASSYITCNPGEPLEYAPSGYLRFSGGRVLPGGGVGGGVEIAYSSINATKFLGCERQNDPSNTNVTGSTVKQLVNTNPDWDKSPPRWEAYNYYCIAGVDIVRWKNIPNCTILADNSDVNSVNQTMTLTVGQGALLPASGQLYGYVPQAFISSNVAWIGDTSSNVINFTYQGRSGDTLTGVTKSTFQNMDLGVITGLQLTSVGSGIFPSYITQGALRVSRRADPNDHLTNLGNNTDWDDINGSFSMNARSETLSIRFPVGTRSNYYSFARWIVVDIYQMSDGGRAKINSLNVYRMPKTYLGDIGGVNGFALQVGQTTSSIANKILDSANIPAYQRDCTGGFYVDTLQISTGNVADTLKSLAQKGGSIAYESMIGVIRFEDDHRIPGAPLRRAELTITGSTLWNNVKETQKSNHSVGQVILNASNPNKEEIYTATYPSTPLSIGTVQNIDKVFVGDLAGASAMAARIFRRANGGYTIEVPLGMFYCFNPFDIVRVNLPSANADAGGVEMNRDFFIKGWKAKLDKNGMTGTLTLEEFITI